MLRFTATLALLALLAAPAVAQNQGTSTSTPNTGWSSGRTSP